MPKMCPECHEEYTLAATRCADCDVYLVDGGEVAVEEEELENFPPASELECVRVAPLPWIRALSEALQQGGVVHRVEPGGADAAPEGQRPEVFGDVQLFGLYVRIEHASRGPGNRRFHRGPGPPGRGSERRGRRGGDVPGLRHGARCGCDRVSGLRIAVGVGRWRI